MISQLCQHTIDLKTDSFFFINSLQEIFSNVSHAFWLVTTPLNSHLEGLIPKQPQLRTTKGKDTICNFPSKNYPRQNNDVSALWLSQHALTLFTHSSSCFFFSLHPHHALHIIIPPPYKSQSGKSMLNMVQIQA
jgi:hypothetical protein